MATVYQWQLCIITDICLISHLLSGKDAIIEAASASLTHIA